MPPAKKSKSTSPRKGKGKGKGKGSPRGSPKKASPKAAPVNWSKAHTALEHALEQIEVCLDVVRHARVPGVPQLVSQAGEAMDILSAMQARIVDLEHRGALSDGVIGALKRRALE